MMKGSVSRLRIGVDDFADDTRIAAIGNDHDEFVAAEPHDQADIGILLATAIRRGRPRPAARRRSNGRACR